MKISRFTSLVPRAKFNLIGLTLSSLFPIAGAALLWVNSQNFPMAVPLWYSKPFGEEQLTSPNFLWVLPIVCIFLIIVNFTLANVLWRIDRVLSYILIWVTPIACGLIFISLLEIILITT